MNRLTTAAKGELPSEPDRIIQKLHLDILKTQETGPEGPYNPLWMSLDLGKNQQCVDDVALFHDKVIPMLLGSTYGVKMFLYARFDGSTHDSVNNSLSELEKRTCAGTYPYGSAHGEETLRLLTTVASGDHDYANPNYYEAVMVCGTDPNMTYYAPGIPEQSSKESVLSYIFSYVSWYFETPPVYTLRFDHCQPPAPGPAAFSWPGMVPVP